MRSWHAFLPESVILMFGIAGGLAAGLFMKGSSLVGWNEAAFEFIVLGAGVSAVFIGWRRRGFWESTTHALSYALFCAIPAREEMMEVFAFAAGLFLVASLAFQLTWNLQAMRVLPGRALLLGLAFVLYEVVRVPLIQFMTGGEIAGPSLTGIQTRGVLGLGVGTAIEMACHILRFIEAHTGHRGKVRVRRHA